MFRFGGLIQANVTLMRLTQSQLSSNPIFVRFAGRSRWIPSPAILLLAWVAEGSVTKLSAPYRFRSLIPGFPGFPLVELMLTGWFVVFVLPAIIAAAAAAWVAHDARSNEYQLLTLTNFSATSRVNGYVAGILYRMRFFLILLAVLLPLMAQGMIAVEAAFKQAFIYLMYCPPNDVRCSPYIHTETPQFAIIAEAFLLPLMIWGLILLPARLGVLVGLKWRHNPLAIWFVGIILLLLDRAVIHLWHLTRWRSWSTSFPLAHLGICVSLFVLSLAIGRLARRWT